MMALNPTTLKSLVASVATPVSTKSIPIMSPLQQYKHTCQPLSSVIGHELHAVAALWTAVKEATTAASRQYDHC